MENENRIQELCNRRTSGWLNINITEFNRDMNFLTSTIQTLQQENVQLSEENASLDGIAIALELAHQKIQRYEKVFCIILKMASDQENDEWIEKVADLFIRQELTEHQESEALEGVNLLAQFLK